MPNETPPHAPSPSQGTSQGTSRGPAHHVLPHSLPEGAAARHDPFAVEGDHKIMRPNSHPEESGTGGDGWTAAKGAVLFVLGAAVVALLLYSLLA
jgi:hypothetical protein